MKIYERKVVKLDLNYANNAPNGFPRYAWRDGSPALASNDAEYAPYNDRNIYADRIDRLGWLGKEKDLESGLGDHGVRKYDAGSGRFLSVDPLWEKYLSWTPYQYSANNPVNAYDVDGREVRVYSERVTATTISNSQQSNLKGFLVNLASPRHTFINVITDKVNVILELGGPESPSIKGNLITTSINDDFDISRGRAFVKEHKVTEPKEDSKYEFENNIINTFNNMVKNKDKLPDYKGYPGPNSNGFIEFLIEENGGKLDPIPGAYGQEITAPYKEAAKEKK